MPPRITWLGKALDKVERRLVPQLTEDLKATFPTATGIAVSDCFGGYTQKQHEKVVLGIEARDRRSYHTHVVKLGIPEEVEEDYTGWEKCVLSQNFASRIFVTLDKRDLPGGRTAIIYEDAFRLFGDLGESEGPRSLESVVFQAIHANKPDPLSVERVIRQLYTELYRWFYRSARSDANAALRYYQRRLRKGLAQWASDPWRFELRRDLVWLLCSHEIPGAMRQCAYIDPYEYVSWAIHEKHLPQTLVGRSHGDLHGRNVLVGVQRGEAEYPAVFDYGEMHNRNVIVWDFVKLEIELKVRFLLTLYEDPEARERMLYMDIGDSAVPEMPPQAEIPTAEMDPRSLRARLLAFSFRFEHMLASLTRRIHQLADPDTSEPPGGRNITGNPQLDRAFGILMRIRQEAAFYLGDGQPQRGKRGLWRDEYYFALAVYGLSTGKFDYRETESCFALVSAGVAIAQMDMAKAAITNQLKLATKLLTDAHSRVSHPYPSYRVPLGHARRIWKGRRTAKNLQHALDILKVAEKRYGHAVPLHQEYVLLLAEAGRYEEALRLLGPLEDICAVFRDEETLCRVGRLCKDLGDRAVEEDPVPLARLSGHPARQWYEAALQRYSDAFALDENYYPGVNAATLARLTGNVHGSQALAKRVLKACRRLNLSSMHVEDCFWVLATRGEATLLLGRGADAAEIYREALGLLRPLHLGMAQSAYNQLCRLHWALGKATDPAFAVFKRSAFRLSPGPLQPTN